MTPCLAHGGFLESLTRTTGSLFILKRGIQTGLVDTDPVTMEPPSPQASPEEELRAQFDWFYRTHQTSIRTFIRSLVPL
ncbi:MAG: hypothetical protein RLZZ253_224 [Verrucomicrobiota bacterium]